MKTVVSTVPESRFRKYQVFFPGDWTVKYVDVPYTDEQLIEACKDVNFLFVGSIHQVSAEVIEKCSHLKMIHVEGVGFDKVDVAKAKELGIPVCNNRAVNNGAVAEHTIGLILAAMRRTALCNEQLYTIGYSACKAEHLAKGQHELAGKTVGLIGGGAIGREVAKRLAGWDCRICYYDVFRLSAEMEQALKMEYMELEDLVAAADIISLHVPVLENTYHMINWERIARMKDGAILINTARGEIVDQEALVEGLEAGKIVAALDTIYPEPPAEDHPVLNLSAEAKKRLVLTPHVAGMTDEAFTRMLINAIANFERVCRNEKPVNVVNGV